MIYMKLGLFADSHYSSAAVTCGNRFNSESLRKIREAYAFFAAQACDFVICLGDLIDHEPDHEKETANLREIADVIHSSHIPTVCLMGNHDGFSFDVDSFYHILGDECRPVNRSEQGRNLIFLDACYFQNGKHYSPGVSDWTDTFYPHANALKETLSSMTGDTYIFMHQNIDPTVPHDHRLANADDICRIAEASGIVKTVYQGHYHPGNTFHRGGIQYITLPAMCEKEHAYFAADI